VLSLDYGLRYSHFSYIGPGTAYYYGDTTAGIRRPVVGAQKFPDGKAIASYDNLEPRLSFKVQANSESSIKGSYNRMVQYLHLMSNTTASNPLDVWNPSSNNIKPQLADQFTLGYFRDPTKDKRHEFSFEGYVRYTEPDRLHRRCRLRVNHP
jgi:hypothetical protein